jgi:GT2 family glycosyltransferase
MDVSIIILNYKTAGLVRQCIKTIGLYRPTVSFEIVVVDNASGDGIGEMLRRDHPDVRFIGAPENLGFAAGNNLGIRAARGRYVLIMNPDITVREGAIDAMVAYLDANRDIGALGPRLVRPDGSLDESCYRFPTPEIPIYRRTPLGRTSRGKGALARYTMTDFDRKDTRDVDWLLGAAIMVRTAALAEVGLLDERFFLYFEDADWCRRFWRSGHRVTFFVGAEMVHYHERESARGNWLLSPFRRSTRIHISSAFKYFRKWKGDGTEGPAKA